MPSPWPVPAVALSPVAAGTVRWRMGGVARLTVVVKATFGFVHEGTARLLPPLDLARDDHLHGGVLDLAAETAPFLPGAGVLLAGHACAPRGKPARSVAVRLGVYRDVALIDKTLHVFAERGRDFRKLPLGWQRAARSDDNPAGSSGAPGIVDPAHPGRPAGFGPIPRHWPARRRWLGALDPQLLGPAATEIPEGIDFRFFHAAPPDQQIDYLRGDEWIVLDGMHPALPRVRTRLLRARAEARWCGTSSGNAVDLVADTLVIDADHLLFSVIWRGCFVLSEEDPPLHVEAGLSLPDHPVAWRSTRAETPTTTTTTKAPPASLAFDDDATQAVTLPEAEREALPFRRTVHGDLDHAPLVTPESVLPFRPPGAPPAPVPAPAPAPRREQLMTLAGGEIEDDATGAVDLRDFRDLAPFAVAEPGSPRGAPGAPIPGAPWSTPAVRPPPVDAFGLSTLALCESEPVPTGETLRNPLVFRPVPVPVPAARSGTGTGTGTGTGRTEGILQGETPKPPAQPDPPASLFQLGAPLPPPPAIVPPAVVPPAVVPPAVVPPAVVPPAVVPPAVAPLPVPPPALPSAAVVAPPASALRDKVVAALAAREALRGLDLRNADLRGIDFRGALLAGCKLGGADLTGCVLVDARLADADLVGAALGRADLTGADLTRADLSRATVGEATFAGAILADANLTAAKGQGASFAGAHAPRTTFVRGVWDGAVFERLEATGADFTGASLAGARFDQATLIELCLDDVQGAGASFDGARLPGAHADTASFPRASFKGAEAPGSVWEQATLDEATFAGADLKDASFNRASAPGASFAGARLMGANLARLGGEGADLRRAMLEGADLRAARLAGASLEGADLRGILGQKADFSRARLEGADLTGANLRQSRLGGASLAGAELASADLRDADLEGADLTGASRRTAKMNGANLKDVIGGGEG